MVLQTQDTLYSDQTIINMLKCITMTIKGYKCNIDGMLTSIYDIIEVTDIKPVKLI